MPKQIALCALVDGVGTATAAWRHPDVEPSQVNDIAYYERVAQLAERGFFDMFFIADSPATRTDNLEFWTQSPLFQNGLEPMTLQAAVARATKHIGLGATVSSSFFEPYNIARQFAALDHISHGRAAWNVVTSANDYAARNFGQDRLAPHDERYAMARESYEIVASLWDTWEDDAFVFDKEGARNFDPAKYHVTDFEGQYFRVHGGLNVARSPQGRPVIIQAGASEAGKEFAAETAEVVFGPGTSIDAAKAFYDDLKGRMAKFGREPDELKIVSGMQVIVGRTEAEALEKKALIESVVPIDAKVVMLANDLEAPLSDLPLDEPIPLTRVPDHSNTHQLYWESIVEQIRQGRTLREIAMWYNRNVPVLYGDAVTVADFIQDWVDQGAGDGVMLSAMWAPGNLADFVDLVVPELQRRGRLRTAYEGTTLRDHLGLKRPANSFVATLAEASV